MPVDEDGTLKTMMWPCGIFALRKLCPSDSRDGGSGRLLLTAYCVCWAGSCEIVLELQVIVSILQTVHVN